MQKIFKALQGNVMDIFEKLPLIEGYFFGFQGYFQETNMHRFLWIF